ncbi:ABC transporter ATP-binding protein [Arthrobacter sp. LS16]|uniref:ABC transporter ATP-binding protein n=1 Tax=Glutamicibacter soli TaxID=453836 RepID=A0A365YJ55_9MICC|nr:MULTISPECIES: ABC transporter ATP-binding protein [Micrococcaceae]RBM02702.1 ABC transporter ATP-binding protein [Glutamicibacter soli]RKS20753.1 peptide/nickel transport system ATP-binding protein [Arthrobacter sp. AG1021]
MSENATPKPLLEVKDLAITFSTPDGPVHAVRDANFTVMPGETVAIVGESGSGKSTSALAAIGLLAGNGRVSAGQILFDGEDIANASEKRFVELRGNHIGMVPQDPMSNLNPVWKIGFQVKETLKANGLAGDNPKKRVAQVLADAGLPNPEARANQYPHEFSGGMRQRALIAIGLACRPRLLIADEPTSALDVTVQQQILDHLDTMTSELGTAVLLITHDLGLAAERAEKVVVMYKGRVVEYGPALEILRNPKHPYTQRLINSAPSLSAARGDKHEAIVEETSPAKAEPLLSVSNLTKVFDIRKGFGKKEKFTAVDNVSFEIPKGTTTAVVGESGSGKSTIAQMVLNLLDSTSGEITFDGQQIGNLSEKQLFKYRRRVQPIFQDPYGSLDPMYSIYRTIEEPLRIHGIGNSASRQKKVKELLDQVSMPAATMHRFPNELSGGQRQRIAIARALALQPEMIVCDEAVSALDVLVQAQVLELLDELQRDMGLTYLFITHDLAVVRQIADNVCVMERGKIVEQGSVDDIFDAPKSDYTRNLLAAIPGATLI